MRILKVSHLIAFLIIFAGQFVSLSKADPSLAKYVEGIITALACICFYFAFVGDKLARIVSCGVAFIYGSFYFGGNLFFYFSENIIHLRSFIAGILCIASSLLIFLRTEEQSQTSGKERSIFLYSLMPSGYIMIMSIHKAYPIEANLTVLALEALAIVTSFFIITYYSKIFVYAFLVSSFFLTFIFVSYAFIGFFSKNYGSTLDYGAYAVVLLLIVALSVQQLRTMHATESSDETNIKKRGQA